jgi:16S rRNA (cytosine1402-N4)-methyltransferase
VSFHSLEDRIVKQFLKERTGYAESVSRHMPIVTGEASRSFVQPVKKAVLPQEKETRVNPRARSAKLRWATRLPLREALHESVRNVTRDGDAGAGRIRPVSGEMGST